MIINPFYKHFVMQLLLRLQMNGEMLSLQGIIDMFESMMMCRTSQRLYKFICKAHFAFHAIFYNPSTIETI